VLVVVVAVSCVSAAVVDVVDVVAMRDRHVATAVAVNVLVLRMHLMPVGGLAFVVVIVVPSMKVTVVQIVDVITVRDRNVSAALAVDMRVIDVFVVNCFSHRFTTTVSTRFRLYRCARTPTIRDDSPFVGRNGWRLRAASHQPVADTAKRSTGCRMPTTPSKTLSLCGSPHSSPITSVIKLFRQHVPCVDTLSAMPETSYASCGDLSLTYQLFGDGPAPRRWPVREVNHFGYIMERREGLFTVVQLPVAPCTAVCQNDRRLGEVASFPLMGRQTSRRSGEAGFELCVGPTTAIPPHRGVLCPT
jgi:hypothetical protein